MDATWFNFCISKGFDKAEDGTIESSTIAFINMGTATDFSVNENGLSWNSGLGKTITMAPDGPLSEHVTRVDGTQIALIDLITQKLDAMAKGTAE